MAASLFIEEESGTYNARFRQHPHNGYYAGDFSQTSRSGSERVLFCAERRDVPRAWQWWGTDGVGSATTIPAR